MVVSSVVSKPVAPTAYPKPPVFCYAQVLPFPANVSRGTSDRIYQDYTTITNFVENPGSQGPNQDFKRAVRRIHDLFLNGNKTGTYNFPEVGFNVEIFAPKDAKSKALTFVPTRTADRYSMLFDGQGNLDSVTKRVFAGSDFITTNSAGFRLGKKGNLVLRYIKTLAKGLVRV